MSGPIVLVAPNYHPRTCGVGDNSMRVAEELQRRGWRALILTREPAEAHPESPGVEARSVPGRTPLAIARHMLPEIERLAPALVVLQYTPQMLGASRFGSPAMPWLAGRLRRSGIPVIAVAHELFVPLSWRPDLAVGAMLQRLQFIWLMRATRRLAVTTSTRLAIPTLRWFRPHGRELEVVRIGSNALPAPQRVVSPRRRLGVFSTLAVGKRLDVIVGAFARLAPAYPDLELVVVGDLGPGSSRLRELQQQIHAASGGERIRVTGKLPLTQVAEEVAGCAVFLFPMNTGANTRSGTLPVAFACGVPVVAVHGPETDDQIFAHDSNVVFAEALSTEAFAAATSRLLDDPALAKRIGEGGQALFEAHLRWPRIVDRLLELGDLGAAPVAAPAD